MIQKNAMHRSRILSASSLVCFLATVGLSQARVSALNPVIYVRAQIQAPAVTEERKVCPMEKVAPDLMESFRQTPDEPRAFLVYLKAQADLKDNYGSENWEAQGQLVYETLKEKARESQEDLLRYLQTELNKGLVVSFQPFFVVNAIKVVARFSVLETLAARPDVDHIDPVRAYPLPEPILNPDSEPKEEKGGKVGSRRFELLSYRVREFNHGI